VSYSEPPPPPQYGAPPPGAVPAGNNTKALWSLITGIVGLLCCGIVGIVAIILGRSAQAEIAQTGQGGAGMAKAGFILGIIAVAFMILQIILFATGAVDFDGTFETS
jgi:Domain of unknown function (DUF4190)